MPGFPKAGYFFLFLNKIFNMKDLRIVFMGTPDFAVASLRTLVNHGANIVGVITAPDKPAGRGKKLQQSAVKRYALENNLNILQPTNLKAPGFIEELKSLRADLQIVVAFRMLPEIVWAIPPKGTFNLHASLLPQYRGAAPINWAIINGERETGVTTFFLDKEIDTGSIIDFEKTSIGPEETAGELHDRLMEIGSKLVLKTVQNIADGKVKALPQKNEEAKHAPKLNKENTRINWNKKGRSIFNLIRGLSPYPVAYTMFLSPEKEFKLKIYKSSFEASNDNEHENGSIKTDQKTFLKIKCETGWIFLKKIQLESKKRMSIENFLRGFPIKEHHSVK